MASSPLASIDPALWAGLEPFPLSLLSDGNRDTPDFALDGAFVPGGVYSYALAFAAGVDYRFQTSPADDGHAERAMLVDNATGGVLWANAAALGGFGYDPATAALLEARAVTVDTASATTLVLWADIVATPEAPAPLPFHLEARADIVPVTDDPVFRFFDTSTGGTRLTASAEMRDLILAEQPWMRFDGAVMTGDDKPRDGWVPVYEVLDYVTGQRFYTVNAGEVAAIAQLNAAAVNQGVVFWVPGTESEATQPVYRLGNLNNGSSFLTSDQNERLFLLLQGDWADQGIAFQGWVPPPPPAPPPAPPVELPPPPPEGPAEIPLPPAELPVETGSSASAQLIGVEPFVAPDVI